jgi:hypothetical protein
MAPPPILENYLNVSLIFLLIFFRYYSKCCTQTTLGPGPLALGPMTNTPLPRPMGRGCLQTLEFAYCEVLESLPQGLRSISSLTSLDVYSCVEIRSMPKEGLLFRWDAYVHNLQHWTSQANWGYQKNKPGYSCTYVRRITEQTQVYPMVALVNSHLVLLKRGFFAMFLAPLELSNLKG